MTIVRGGTVVLPTGVQRADVAIAGERIAAIGPDLPGSATEIDARGLHVLPGLIDIHLHFNEPGHTDWEGAATGSRALAAGGGTLFFDMPLNSVPCTVNVHEFDRKRDALSASSITDYALWGGLIPGAVPAMADLAARGVVGFKAFMCDSGLPEFPRSDDATLVAGMREAAQLGCPVAVHAESQDMTQARTGRMSGRDVRSFIESRPVAAELEAIDRALQLASDTGAMLHIVHVSSGRGVALAAEARARGVDVSIETCPHYLFFTEEDLERIGTAAKCAPPLRSEAERSDLWVELLIGHVDHVASDHSPTEPARKEGPFADAWGGIAGVQSTLPVLIDRGVHGRGLPLERVARLVSGAGAERFRIAGKGSVAVGFDADLTLVDLGESFTLEAEGLHQRHKISPYIGQSFRGRVRRTIRRGETIFDTGRITAKRQGQLVRPSRTT